MADIWRRCSACKQDIALGGAYYTCSVSTCNRVRTALAFCSVTCWEINYTTPVFNILNSTVIVN